MLSVVENLMQPRRKGRKIVVREMLRKNIIMVSFNSSKIPDKIAYSAMEARLGDYYAKNPNWNFKQSPSVGTFVILIDKKDNVFARGMILKVENSMHGFVYFVFAYDRGEIRKVFIHEIVYLPGEFQFQHPPRSVLIIIPGMVDYQERRDRFKKEAAEAVPSTPEVGEPSPHGKPKRSACDVAYQWLSSREIFVEVHKSLNDIIYVADIYEMKRKTAQQQTGGSTSSEITHGEKYVDYMEKQKLSCVKNSLKAEDKHPTLLNLDSITDRLDEFFNNGKVQNTEPRFRSLRDYSKLVERAFRNESS